jgi:hypothetical protein
LFDVAVVVAVFEVVVESVELVLLPLLLHAANPKAIDVATTLNNLEFFMIKGFDSKPLHAKMRPMRYIRD